VGNFTIKHLLIGLGAVFVWYIAILASFVNFLLPSERVPGGLGWGEKYTTPATIAIYSNPRIICEFLTPERAGSGRVGVG